MLDTEESHSKLKILKENILKHERSFPVTGRRDFSDADTLGNLIFEDLWNAIDGRFPEKDIKSQLERQRMEHEAFAHAIISYQGPIAVRNMKTDPVY